MTQTNKHEDVYTLSTSERDSKNLSHYVMVERIPFKPDPGHKIRPEYRKLVTRQKAQTLVYGKLVKDMFGIPQVIKLSRQFRIVT